MRSRFSFPLFPLSSRTDRSLSLPSYPRPLSLHTESPSSFPSFVEDIEINDLRNRYLLTKGPTQQQILADTGASVLTKGVWYPDKSMATEKDPPLYLHITAVRSTFPPSLLLSRPSSFSHAISPSSLFLLVLPVSPSSLLSSLTPPLPSPSISQESADKLALGVAAVRALIDQDLQLLAAGAPPARGGAPGDQGWGNRERVRFSLSRSSLLEPELTSSLFPSNFLLSLRSILALSLSLHPFATFSQRKWPEEKIFIEFDSIRNFNVKAKTVGPGVRLPPRCTSLCVLTPRQPCASSYSELAR